jgi:hypothetical protein
MHSHLLRRLTHRTALTVSIVLLGTTGVIAGIGGGPFGASACGCTADMVCHIVGPDKGLFMGGNTTTCTGVQLGVRDSEYELEGG